VINPAMGEFTTIHQTLGDLIQEPVSYARFKEKIRLLATQETEQLLVAGIVHETLALLLGLANPDVEKVKARHQGMIDHVQEMLTEELPDWKQAQLEQMAEMSQRKIETMDQDVREFQQFYAKFCEVILGGLIKEGERLADLGAESFFNRRLKRQLSEEEFPGAPKEMPDE
jgi:hypothetical protein